MSLINGSFFEIFQNDANYLNGIGICKGEFERLWRLYKVVVTTGETD